MRLMVKQITIVYWKKKKTAESHTPVFFLAYAQQIVHHNPIRLRRKKAKVLPMQRSLCPVSLNTEKGLRSPELYYLLVITAFPMSLTKTYC